MPWLKQWHNDYDPEHATRMGDYFAAFVADEARALGLSPEDLRSWRARPDESAAGAEALGVTRLRRFAI